MKIHRYIVAAVGVAILALVPAAGAHVTLQPEQAPAGGFTRLDVRVPNEEESADTTKVEVQMPPGFLSVSFEPEPGWSAEVTMRKLDKPVEQFGEQVTEEVGQVTFTADGQAAAIHPGEFRDFGLSVGVPEGRPGSKLTFKALQTYTGEGAHVRRWIGPPDAESPAPQVELTAAEGEEAAAPAAPEPAAAPASEEDDDGNGLAIAALIVGAAGLAAGVAALFLGRRRTRVGAA
jgi:uncharacterized protein YcnI